MKKSNNISKRLSFKDVEIRSFLNDNEGGKKYLEGKIPYGKRSVPLWGSTCEIISRTAFKKTINDGKNVFALYNHDKDKILGSTKSGTLVLENQEDGLLCRVEIPDTTYANDLYTIINRGDVHTMSFGMRDLKHTQDPETNAVIITECGLNEISFGVCSPAYHDTASVAYKRGFEKRNIDLDALNEVLEKENLSEPDILTINETMDILKNILPPTEAVETKPDAESTSSEKEPSNDTLENETDTLAKEGIEIIQFQIEAELALTDNT